MKFNIIIGESLVLLSQLLMVFPQLPELTYVITNDLVQLFSFGKIVHITVATRIVPLMLSIVIIIVIRILFVIDYVQLNIVVVSDAIVYTNILFVFGPIVLVRRVEVLALQIHTVCCVCIVITIIYFIFGYVVWVVDR